MYERTDKRYAGKLLIFTLVLLAAVTTLFISKEEGLGFLVELAQAPEQTADDLLSHRVIAIRHSESGANLALPGETNQEELIDSKLTDLGWN